MDPRSGANQNRPRKPRALNRAGAANNGARLNEEFISDASIDPIPNKDTVKYF
jgi:hypothetical protein